MIMKRIAVIFIYLLSFGALSAQDCNEFQTVQRSGVRYPWKYDSQSKSGIFFANKASTLNIVCNEGKDYKMSFQISSAIMKYVSVKVTDESGQEYFIIGQDATKKKAMEEKKQFMISLENQKLTIKVGKQKKKIEADIENLKLEISKYEEEVLNSSGTSKTYFEFTPAETVNMTVQITVASDCPAKGCVSVLVVNKKSDNSGF